MLKHDHPILSPPLKSYPRANSPFKSGHGPCPVTGERNNWSRTDDGLFCVYGDHQPLYGWTYRGLSSNGGSLYVREDGQDRAYLPPKQTYTKTQPSITLQPVSVRDRAYRALLELCPLTQKHRRELERRGIKGLFESLTLGSLDFRSKGQTQGARSRLVLQILEATGLTREQLAGVGGFYLDSKGMLQISQQSGILIPFYDLQRRIVGLQARAAGNVEGPRYRWLSCGGKGVSSGSPVGFLEGSKDSETIYITEGALKAVAMRSNISDARGFFYLAGVWNVGGLVESLQHLEGVKRACVVFDADSFKNPNVYSALGSIVRLLQSVGLDVEVRGWSLKKGKGIDDYLANGHKFSDTKILDAAGILRGSTPRKQSAYLISSEKKGSRETLILPDVRKVLEAPKEQPTLEEMRAKTEAAFVDALQRPAGTFVLHDGATGTGKTTAFVKHAKEGSIYAATNYKALFEVRDALEAANRPYIELFGRGRRVDPTADPETKARQEEIWEQAGCDYERAETLGRQGHFPCLGCPRYKTDKDERAESCRYWKQRDFAVDHLGSSIVLTLAQTLSSNREFRIDGQDDLFDVSKAHTIIFDDIADPLSILSPSQDINLDDAKIWESMLPKRSGFEERRRDRAYADLVTEIRLCLADPNRELDELYRIGRNAGDFLDLEDPKWRVFRAGDEEIPPLNVFESLASWLRGGLPIKFVNEGSERALRFLRPSHLLDEMPKGRVVWLDATPNKPLMSWLAESLGMDSVQTNLPQPTQNIIQIGDRLWAGEQLDKHPEPAALLDYAEQEGAFIMRKKARALEGDAYFGRDERGLNAFKDAPFTVLEGHHVMSAAQAKEAAWGWEAFAAYRYRPAPLEDAQPLPPKMARTYGDAYRPWQRIQHTISDPLAENIRRHHYSTTILQAVARDRDPNKPKYVLSGTPIELDGKPYPVTLWTLQDLRNFLAEKGFKTEAKKRNTPKHILDLNEARESEKEKRVWEHVATLEALGGFNALSKVSDVRRALGGKNKCEGSFARDVWEALRLKWESQQKHALSLETGRGRDRDVHYINVPVSPPSDFKANSMNVKDISFDDLHPPLVCPQDPPPVPIPFIENDCSKKNPSPPIQRSQKGTIQEPLYRKENYSLLTDREVDFWDQLLDEIPPKEDTSFHPVAQLHELTPQPTISNPIPNPSPLATPQPVKRTSSFAPYFQGVAFHRAGISEKDPFEVKVKALFKAEGGLDFARAIKKGTFEGEDTSRWIEAVDNAARRVCEILGGLADFGKVAEKAAPILAAALAEV